MKRVIIYIAALAAVWFAPVEGANIGTLHPVEAVLIYKEETKVVLQTDTGDVGKGSNAEEALEDLKKTTPGTSYLDTAEYLLLGENTETVAEELRTHLKGNVGLCAAEEGVDPAEAARFLEVHGALPQLQAWKQGADLPYLTRVEKRLKLSEKALDK